MWNSQQIVCVGNCCLNQITRRADQWRKWRCSCFLSIALQRLAHSAALGIGICAKRTIDAIIAHAGSNCCSHLLGVLSSRMVDLAIHQLQKHACMTQPRRCNRYDMLSESQCFSLVKQCGCPFTLSSWCFPLCLHNSCSILRRNHKGQKDKKPEATEAKSQEATQAKKKCKKQTKTNAYPIKNSIRSRPACETSAKFTT